YFPFNVTCYFNGHSFVAQELRRDRVRFRKADNALLVVGDVPALQAAADRLSAALLQRRCNYWVCRVAPVFSPQEREALRPGHRDSTAQIELATEVVFKRRGAAQGIVPAGLRVGCAGGRRQWDDPSLRATHQPALSGQAANRAGSARSRTPGVALV